MRIAVAALMGVTCAGLVPAQRLYLVSEFQRVTPEGTVVMQDRVERRRELISPSVARNTHVSWRVVVEMPPGVPYTLFVAQNPDNTLNCRLYQEAYMRSGGEWIPDGLKKLELPHSAKLGADQVAQTYLLDARVPEDATPGRMRLEVQLNTGDRWIIYPMEVRVQSAVAKAGAQYPATLPEPGARADAAALEAARVALCGKKSNAAPEEFTNVRQMSALNAARDLTLLHAGQEMTEMIPRAAGFKSVEALCRAVSAAPAGAEWWLRLRDYVYQGKRLP